MNDTDRAVRYLLDRLEIQDLVTRYFCAADQRDFKLFVGCFVAETMVDYSELLPVPSAHPIEEVASVIEATMARLYSNTQHFIGNHTVTVDGDRATGETYCLAVHQHIDATLDDDQRPVSFLRYLDRYVRTEHGWRIEHRRVTRDVGAFVAARTAPAPVD